MVCLGQYKLHLLSMLRAHCTGQGGLNSYLCIVNNWASLRLDLFVICIKQWCLGDIRDLSQSPLSDLDFFGSINFPFI